MSNTVSTGSAKASTVQVPTAEIVVSIPLAKHHDALGFFAADSEDARVQIGAAYSRIVESAIDIQRIRRRKRTPSLRRTGALMRKSNI